MSLRIVYGRAGTGKSSFCYEEIKHKIKKDEKIYIITPEQFSFTAEKKLMEVLSQNAVISAEVLTFQRMAYRVMQEVGGGRKTILSSLGKEMLLYYILDKEKDKLTFLGKTDKNVDLIATMLTELKKHNISEEQIKNSIEQIEEPYLTYKMKDISILYEAFQKQIQENYIDENDILTILTKQLKKTELFKNAIIYIDEFVGFTPQEYGIIEVLLKQVKEMTVTVCADKLDVQKQYLPETDLFYSNRKTMNQLIDIADRNHIEREESIYLEKKYRYKTAELKHLEKYMYENKYNKYQEKIENLHLFLASNPYSEVEQAAKNIIALVRDKGYRYKDIAIITKNIETYSSLTKAIFAEYEIPVFMDEKKDLSENNFVKYLLSILEIFSKNFSHEAMFNFIKNEFSSINRKDSFFLENYCLKWGIARNKWYSADWDYDEQAEKMNELRKKIVKPLLNLKEKLSNRKTIEEITRALYEFLEEEHISEKLEEKIRQLEANGYIEIANEYATSWKMVLQIMDELVCILRDEKISFEKYIQIFKIGLGSSGLGKIPATLDQIIMGDVERSRSHKVKAIFVIGLNDGVFPSLNKKEGFLDDENREQLKKVGLELAKTTKERLYEENFNIYKALTTSEEELYLSYSSCDNEGTALRASTLVSKIKKIFPKLREESDMLETQQEIYTKQVTFEELLTNIRKMQDGEEVLEKWKYLFNYYSTNPKWQDKLQKALEGITYTNLPKKVNSQNIQKLYGNLLKTSVSRLEQYRSCPFSFYLKYGLGIKEKEMYKIESVDTGSFMHDVIDEFFEVVQLKQIKLKDITQQDINDIINQIIDEKLILKRNYIFTSTQKYKVLVNRLRRLLVKSIKYIIQTITNSEFKILGNEVEFKENRQYPPIKLKLEDGKQIEITGKIDRIDIGEKEKEKYIRIIDYKSSVKNIDLNQVVLGLQIQLLTYLDAVSKQEDMLPAGVLYFNVIDPIIKANKNMSDEEIEQEIKKKFKMQGLILADVTIVKMMDKNLEKGASDVIPAYLDKDGNLSNNRSSAIKMEQFRDLQKHIHITIKQIAKEILSGNIDLKPYYSVKKKTTPCEYCKYHAICQFDSACRGNEYQYIPNQDKEAVLEKIKTRGDVL